VNNTMPYDPHKFDDGKFAMMGLTGREVPGYMCVPGSKYCQRLRTREKKKSFRIRTLIALAGKKLNG
jgi:hypothetical protein